MDNFIGRVQELNEDDSVPVVDIMTWAVNTWATLAAIGNHSDISDVLGESLARVVAAAPDEVVALGTLAVVDAMVKVQGNK